jgi:hypothetical protein
MSRSSLAELAHETEKVQNLSKTLMVALTVQRSVAVPRSGLEVGIF